MEVRLIQPELRFKLSASDIAVLDFSLDDSTV